MMQKDARIKIKGKIAAFFLSFDLDYLSKALFSSTCEGNLELWGGVERKECKIGTFSCDWNG